LNLDAGPLAGQVSWQIPTTERLPASSIVDFGAASVIISSCKALIVKYLGKSIANASNTNKLYECVKEENLCRFAFDLNRSG
jgi:hypothetical protein